jgi:hypothetical protein
VVRVATTRVPLVVMAQWDGTAGAVSSPLVRSCEGVSATDVQEPGVEEPRGEEPFVEEPFHFRRGLLGSSGESKQGLRW